MKALAVVVAVLFALWLVGRYGAHPARSDIKDGTTRPLEVVGAAGKTQISAEAARRQRP